MGKFRKNKFALSMIVIIIGFVLILNYATDDNSFGFLLAIPPNAIIGFVGDDGEETTIIVGDRDTKHIACWLQNEMEVINRDGESRGFEKSDYLKVNPTLPLRISDAEGSFGIATLTGDGGFIIKPTIRCSVDLSQEGLNPEDTFGINPITGELLFPEDAQFQSNLTIQPSELIIRVYANDESDCELFSCNSKAVYHDIYHAKMDIPKQDIRDNGKKVLNSFKIDDEDLESGLKVNGEYISDLLFTLDGVVLISFENADDYNYVIPTNTERTHRTGITAYGDNNWGNISNDLLTERTIFVQKNVNLPFNDCDVGFHLEPPTGTAPDDCVRDDKPIDEVCGVNEYEDPVGSGICKPIETQPPQCTPPLIQSGNICVNPNTTGGGTGLTGIDIIDDLIICLDSGSPTCLTDPSFLIIWLGLFGIIILIVALAQGRGRGSTDIYGVPTNY